MSGDEPATSQPIATTHLNVVLTKLEGHKVQLEVAVDQAEVDRAYGRAYRRLVNRVSVPGFRRGHVPRPVLERHIGREAFREEALEFILSDSYGQALDAKDLDPIDRPEVEVVKFEEGEPFVFKATVEVRPEVKLGKYTGMGLSVSPREVSQSDIEAQLTAIRERRAELEPAEPESTLEDGLYGVLDYEGTVEGAVFPGGKAEGALVQIGAGQIEPQIEEAIKGARAGQERKATVTFPPDIPNQELQGKEAAFKIQVKEIKRKKLPELTDELATEITGLDLPALRERISQSLEERAKSEAREELTRQVVEKVTAEAEVDAPEILVRRRIERMTADTEERLKGQNLDLDQYLKIIGLEREQWDKDLRARAEHAVKKDLVLGAVGRREKILATEPEIEFEIARTAAAYRQKPEKMRAFFYSSADRLESLRAGIITQKTVQYLVRRNTTEDAARTDAQEAEGK
jgi:trigger factor